jgi:hypothetical protein
MKSILAGLSVLCVSAIAVLPASAGWDNVFQPTLFERWRRPTTTAQYYVAPAVVAQYQPPVVVQYQPAVVAQYQPAYVAQSAPCDPCEQKKCTTNYVQRSYYQPVTSYQSKNVMEQVTTMRTSYYYEPVTSYRYSNYFDPCTGCAQQVAVPTTSYQLKAQSSPVQSWVSRCVQVPVQGYQKVDYWQPQTTCCTTTQGAPMIGSPPTQVPPMQPPVQAPIPAEQPPSISGSKTPATGMQFYPPVDRIPEIRNSTSGSSFQPRLGLPVPVQTNAPQAPNPQPPVRLNQIAVGPDSRVEGQVARSDNSPKANAKVLFINASTGKRQTIFANTAGRFHTDLAPGSWHVYVHGADDLPIYNTRVDVNGAQSRQVNLVSRSN